MAEVRYLIYCLLRELMQTPLVDFDGKKKKKAKKNKNGEIKNQKAAEKHSIWIN